MNKKGLFAAVLLLAVVFCLAGQGEENKGKPYYHVDFEALLKEDGTAEIT